MNRLVLISIFILLGFTGKAARTELTINSGWYFYYGAEAPAETDRWQRVDLPHTWNAEDAFDQEKGYARGTGWYQHTLRVPAEWEGRTVMLHFEGANQKSTVYINGERVLEHTGGYTAFRADLTEGLIYGSDNIIMVGVDNGYDADVPPLTADFNFYGGIYRNVRLIVASPVHFDLGNEASDGIFITTPVVNDATAEVGLHGRISNTTGQKQRIVLSGQLKDRKGNQVAASQNRITIEPHSTHDFRIDPLTVGQPELWSPEDPALYTYTAQLRCDGVELDRIDLPVGLRWYRFDADEGFFLNGKPYKLIGANRHQDFKGMGNALPDEYHRRDFEMIKDMGFNFVRLAHYPQAPEVYRTCDRLGLLVWSEIPVVNLITESEAFTRNSLNMQREHIRQTRNHPSVILYGYMNEILLQTIRNSAVTPEQFDRIGEATRALAQKLEDLTREEAPEHTTCMAIHPNEVYDRYGISTIAQVLGHNVYFGWYYGECEDMTGYFADQHARHPTIPHLVSEYGPGADIRNHTVNPVPWDFSEEYQIVMHTSYLEQMMAAPYIAGFALWNFADFGAEHRGDAEPWINQKGLVNFDRSEKDVCGLYRAWFTRKPVVRIASANYTSRTWLEDTPGSMTCTQPVTVLANGETVELLHNGRSIGKKATSSCQASFEVPFVPGENTLEAVDERGVKDLLRIRFRVIPHRLDDCQSLDLAVNVGAYQAYCDFGSDTQWIPDREYTPGHWGRIGGKVFIKVERREMIGISNDIHGTAHNPLFQTFATGIEGYRFDVGDGRYLVELCMVEHNPDGVEPEIIYNMYSGRKEALPPVKRIFDILLNGETVMPDIDLPGDYGHLRSVTIKLTAEARDGRGVEVGFNPVEGEAVLSGIRITKIN